MNNTISLKEAYSQAFENLEECVWRSKDITLIECGSLECRGIKAFADYLADNNISSDIIKEVKIIDVKSVGDSHLSSLQNKAEFEIKELFPASSVHIISKLYAPDEKIKYFMSSNSLFAIFLFTDCQKFELDSQKGISEILYQRDKHLYERYIFVNPIKYAKAEAIPFDDPDLDINDSDEFLGWKINVERNYPIPTNSTSNTNVENPGISPSERLP